MRSEYAITMRDAADVPDEATRVAGVRWLGGVPATERSTVQAVAARHAEPTFVIGRAHGPRLLELLCAAG